MKFRAFRGFSDGRRSRAKSPRRKGGEIVYEIQWEIFSRKKAKNRRKKENPNPSSLFCVLSRLLAANSHPSSETPKPRLPSRLGDLAIEPEASHSPWPIANLPDCASHLNPPLALFNHDN